MRQKAARNPEIPIKAHTKTHLLTGIYPKLQQRKSSLGGTRDIQEKTELYSCKTKSRGIATTLSMLSLPPVQPIGGRHLACVKPALHMAKSDSALAW